MGLAPVVEIVDNISIIRNNSMGVAIIPKKFCAISLYGNQNWMLKVPAGNTASERRSPDKYGSQTILQNSIY